MPNPTLRKCVPNSQQFSFLSTDKLKITSSEENEDKIKLKFKVRYPDIITKNKETKITFDLELNFCIARFSPVKFSKLKKDEIELRYFLLPELQVHMFPEAVDEDLFKDYTKDKEDDIKCVPDEVHLNNYIMYYLFLSVLMRNMITGEKIAAKKAFVLKRIPVELPCKSVRNSFIYIKEIICLIQKALDLEDIQIKDYRCLITEMLEKDLSSKFYAPPPPQSEQNKENGEYSDNYEKEPQPEEPQSQEDEPQTGFTTANNKLKKGSSSFKSGNKSLGMFQTASTFKKATKNNPKEETKESVKTCEADIEMESTEESAEMSHSQETKHKDKLLLLEDALKLISNTKTENIDLDLTDVSMVKPYIESNEQFCQFLENYYNFLSVINPEVNKPPVRRKQKEDKVEVKKYKIKVKTSIDWTKA